MNEIFWVAGTAVALAAHALDELSLLGSDIGQVSDPQTVWS